MYWVSGWLTILEARISSSLSGVRRHAFGLRAPFANALAATLARVDVGDAVLGHVALDLHGEELRGEHQAGLAVPGADAPFLRQGVERPSRVLVEADDERHLGRTGDEHRVSGGQRRPARRAPVLDVDERHAGQPEDRDRRVRVAGGVRTAGGEVDVLPRDPRVRRARDGRRWRPSRARTRRRAGRTAWMPTPTTATSSPPLTRPPPNRPEGERQLVARPGDGDQCQLHGHTDPQPLRIALGQARLHADLARQLDVPDAVGLELLHAPLGDTAAPWAQSTGSSRSTARRAWRAHARGHPRRCTAGMSAGAGRSPCRTVRSRSRSASAPAEVPPITSGSISCRVARVRHGSGGNARTGERATMYLRIRPDSSSCADRQERADAFAVIPARLAERELDIATDAAVHDVVSPALGVTRVDESTQLLEAAQELTALARVIGGPLDRELHDPPPPARASCGGRGRRAARSNARRTSSWAWPVCRTDAD